MREKGGDSDWYGYCVDDPVNKSDPYGLMGVVGALPPPMIARGIKAVGDALGLNPMSMERVIKEIADNEMNSPLDNATGDQPSQEQWEMLKKSMDEEGVPGRLESGKRYLKDNGMWPF